MATSNAATTPYIALLLSVASSDAADYRPLYCEDFVLLHATSVAHAEQKARELGERRQTSYRNSRGETITWTFVKIIDVAPAFYDNLSDDTELYSRHFRNIEAYELFDADLQREPGE